MAQAASAFSNPFAVSVRSEHDAGAARFVLVFGAAMPVAEGDMKKRTLIKGGVIVSVDPTVGDLPIGDVLIEGDRITGVASRIEGIEGVEIIDATNRLVMPGMIDTHRHTWQALFRNIASDWTLSHYLTGLHGTVSELYRPEDTYAGNLLGGLEALDSGITTLLDWCHNLKTPDHTDAAVQAHFDSGGRVVFAHGGGYQHWAPPSSIEHPGHDVRRLRKGRLSSDDQRVTLCLAPRGNQFATFDATIRDWALANELGLRISCHAGDGEWGKRRPIAALARHGMLDSTMTFVHCNSLADDELKMMADAGCSASVSPDIELQMGHGWPATGRLLRAGIRPSLSIDVCSSNGGHMFGTMRAAIGTQRGFDNEQARNQGKGSVDKMEITCRHVLEFATIEGARACGMEAKIGSLTPGKLADIILVRTDTFGMTPLNNPVGQFVYNAHPGLIDTVLVGGCVVKRNGAVTTVEPEKVLRMAYECRDDIVRRAAGRNGLRLGGDWSPKPYPAAL
jgi:5-methylthioadenosine/S-adenosylhomocysteine deaminase